MGFGFPDHCRGRGHFRFQRCRGRVGHHRAMAVRHLCGVVSRRAHYRPDHRRKTYVVMALSPITMLAHSPLPPALSAYDRRRCLTWPVNLNRVPFMRTIVLAVLTLGFFASLADAANAADLGRSYERSRAWRAAADWPRLRVVEQVPYCGDCDNLIGRP